MKQISFDKKMKNLRFLDHSKITSSREVVFPRNESFAIWVSLLDGNLFVVLLCLLWGFPRNETVCVIAAPENCTENEQKDQRLKNTSINTTKLKFIHTKDIIFRGESMIARLCFTVAYYFIQPFFVPPGQKSKDTTKFIFCEHWMKLYINH